MREGGGGGENVHARTTMGLRGRPGMLVKACTYPGILAGGHRAARERALCARACVCNMITFLRPVLRAALKFWNLLCPPRGSRYVFVH